MISGDPCQPPFSIILTAVTRAGQTHATYLGWSEAGAVNGGGRQVKGQGEGGDRGGRGAGSSCNLDPNPGLDPEPELQQLPVPNCLVLKFKIRGFFIILDLSKYGNMFLIKIWVSGMSTES